MFRYRNIIMSIKIYSMSEMLVSLLIWAILEWSVWSPQTVTLFSPSKLVKRNANNSFNQKAKTEPFLWEAMNTGITSIMFFCISSSSSNHTKLLQWSRRWRTKSESGFFFKKSVIWHLFTHPYTLHNANMKLDSTLWWVNPRTSCSHVMQLNDRKL